MDELNVLNGYYWEATEDVTGTGKAHCVGRADCGGQLLSADGLLEMGLEKRCDVGRELELLIDVAVVSVRWSDIPQPQLPNTCDELCAWFVPNALIG